MSPDIGMPGVQVLSLIHICKTALILLGASVLSGLVFLLFGGGPNGMAAALTSMLCMGCLLYTSRCV